MRYYSSAYTSYIHGPAIAERIHAASEREPPTGGNLANLGSDSMPFAVPNGPPGNGQVSDAQHCPLASFTTMANFGDVMPDETWPTDQTAALRSVPDDTVGHAQSQQDAAQQLGSTSTASANVNWSWDWLDASRLSSGGRAASEARHGLPLSASVLSLQLLDDMPSDSLLDTAATALAGTATSPGTPPLVHHGVTAAGIEAHLGNGFEVVPWAADQLFAIGSEASLLQIPRCAPLQLDVLGAFGKANGGDVADLVPPLVSTASAPQAYLPAAEPAPSPSPSPAPAAAPSAEVPNAERARRLAANREHQALSRARKKVSEAFRSALLSERQSTFPHTLLITHH